ncbi:hypothetical protein EDB80DRAFT_868648 [Ilyonectria destructans]|nr:hypothetical protein EDB80DRAFT_868648 [Ilyonectria destructans]
MLLPTPEPPVPPVHTRIRWKCQCGQKLFDDFVETRPGSLGVLLARLQEQNTTEAPTQRQENSFQQRIQTIYQSLHTLGTWIKQSVVQALPTMNGGSSELPLHTLSTQSQQHSTNDQEVLHLLMCIDTGEFSTQLYQNRLQRVTNDGELFQFLRDHCVKHRNYASWFTLLQGRCQLVTFIGPKCLKKINLMLLDLGRVLTIESAWKKKDKGKAKANEPEEVREPKKAKRAKEPKKDEEVEEPKEAGEVEEATMLWGILSV